MIMIAFLRSSNNEYPQAAGNIRPTTHSSSGGRIKHGRRLMRSEGDESSAEGQKKHVISSLSQCGVASRWLKTP